jgi:hypothetical protein
MCSDTAEGDTGGGGAEDVRRGRQPEEDLHQEIVGDRQRDYFLVHL